jgi:peptidoglycan/xylan/chitin deacetylase (PgdA/CDA1 family)
MRASLKKLAEAALLYGGPAHLSRRGVNGRALILAYHNIVPDRSAAGGDRSLHLPQSDLSRQLDLIQEHFEVVPLQQILAGTDGIRPRVAITFDDAYRGALTLGGTELVRRALPATFFVAPGYLGGRSFWWDAIATPGGDAISESTRSEALDSYRGQELEIRTWAQSRGWTLEEPGPWARCAEESDLHALLSNPGMQIGSHTMTHPNLALLAGPELERELRQPLEWLREHFVGAVDWLAYPYGLTTPAVARAAENAGYSAALLVRGGWSEQPIPDRYAIPRFNVPAGISPNGFALRLAGMFCH